MTPAPLGGVMSLTFSRPSLRLRPGPASGSKRALCQGLFGRRITMMPMRINKRVRARCLPHLSFICVPASPSIYAWVPLCQRPPPSPSLPAASSARVSAANEAVPGAPAEDAEETAVISSLLSASVALAAFHDNAKEDERPGCRVCRRSVRSDLCRGFPRRCARRERF